MGIEDESKHQLQSQSQALEQESVMQSMQQSTHMHEILPHEL